MGRQSIRSKPARGSASDPEYDAFLARINLRFRANTNEGKEPVFTTDADGLFAAYLAALPCSDRQHHTCSACRHFVERFGGLVIIDQNGRTRPAMWDEEDAPEFYRSAVATMAKLVRRAKVTGVFLSSHSPWGEPKTGEWHHLSVVPPPAILFHRETQSSGQAMAEKREDYRNVIRSLEEFPVAALDQAVTILKSEALYRSEKLLGQAEWLHGLQNARKDSGKVLFGNLLWLAVAKAPAGFCHPRASMIGSLLEDIASGMDFTQVSRRFADKMHPLQYQRPQVAPKAGNIAQAEKLVAQLNASGSLARRFAKLDEIQALWKPTEKTPERSEGVFGHLKAKGQESAPAMRVPAQTMTWEKFRKTILPTAEAIDFWVSGSREPFSALVTAVNPDAPPILQWDLPEHRNPVSWYLYHGGSSPCDWGLSQGWCPVTAVTLGPQSWGDESAFMHHGQHVFLILQGCKDTRESGNAIFPETLKSEFHGIRATIEAYSRSAKLEGRDESSANGIMLCKGQPWHAVVRVRSGSQTMEYLLDRWD